MSEMIANYRCDAKPQPCGWVSTDTSRPLSRGTKVGCPNCQGDARFTGGNVDPTIAAAEAEWLKYVNGTYSEADKRVFVAAFVKGVEWQRRRVKAQERYKDDYERRYGNKRNCY